MNLAIKMLLLNYFYFLSLRPMVANVTKSTNQAIVIRKPLHTASSSRPQPNIYI